MPILYRDIFVALDREQINYLVAGGFAVNLHQVQRATVDLDLILDLNESNVLKFVGVATQLGFKPRVPVAAIDLANAEKRHEWIREKGMMVFSFHNPQNPFETIDIFVEEPKPFADLASRQLVVEAFGVKIKVLGRDDLIELKIKAGRDKDLYDVKQLQKSR